MFNFRTLIFFSLSFCFLVSSAHAVCPFPGPPGLWNMHRCGKGNGHCAESIIPPAAPVGSASPLPPVTDFTDIYNKMPACCGMGWGENADGAQKFDCLEAVAPAAPTYETFLAFYNKGSEGHFRTDAGVVYPNRMFVVGKDGIPLNGFYEPSGRRCFYRNPTTKEKVRLSAADQMALFDAALLANKPPVGTSPAEVDPSCCNLVIFALERKCPENDVIGGIQVALDDTVAGVTYRRCTAAKEMKLNFAVIDLCDQTLVGRARFRTATSYRGENPNKVTMTNVSPITISNLVSEFYPQPGPSASPVPACPSSAFYLVPWSNGACRLHSPEPSP